MKKIILICMVLVIAVIAGCNIPEKVSPEMMRTIIAETMQAKVNFIASQTPPTETPTITPSPTNTLVPTETPTPTLVPTSTWAPHEAGSAEVFVLFYNNIAKDRNDDPYYQWESDLFIPPVEFEQQVRILYELGYTSIGLSDLVKVLRSGGDLPERPVLFTFDSTEPGEYKNAYPILKKYGFAGNLMVQFNHVDAKQSLSSDQIREMMADGWEIGCAGYYGNGMTGSGSMGQEIGQSKPALEKLFGVDVQVFAYPDGYTDPAGEMIQRVSQYGYFAAFAGDLRSTTMDLNHIYYLPRYLIKKGMTYNEFFDMLPWKEGTISQETMEWLVPTPTIENEYFQLTVEVAEVTQAAMETEMAASAGS